MRTLGALRSWREHALRPGVERASAGSTENYNATFGEQLLQLRLRGWLSHSVLAEGAALPRECLRLGLLEAIELHLVPVLLGGGVSLLGRLDRPAWARPQSGASEGLTKRADDEIGSDWKGRPPWSFGSSLSHLCVLGRLAERFGVDSTPGLSSHEEEAAASGMTWTWSRSAYRLETRRGHRLAPNCIGSVRVSA